MAGFIPPQDGSIVQTATVVNGGCGQYESEAAVFIWLNGHWGYGVSVSL